MAASTSEICTVRGIKPRMTYKGQIRHTYVENYEYVSFINIPYAAPPKGPAKYQPAKSPVDENPDQPTPTYEVDLTEKLCTQPAETMVGYEGSVDCLYLNIYLPKRPEEIQDPLPVLVYIHGGGFSYGCNAEKHIPPDFIVQHGLVFVTINYRLGAYGFLNLGEQGFSGNVGLKDQVKALQWIRDNIQRFKGDPTNVTLSGQSAGGTCVNMHLISTSSKGLFHKAIVQSGGVYCPWGFKGHQREERTVVLRDPRVQQLLHDEGESDELHKHAANLIEKDQMKRLPETFGTTFGPTVERFRQGAFITEPVEKAMKKVIDLDIPVMAGITEEEGLLNFLLYGIDDYDKIITDDKRLIRFLRDNLRWSRKTAKNCSKLIKGKYFPKHLRRHPEEKYRCLMNLFRDVYFRRFYDNFKFGPKRTLPRNLFVYRFDHVSEISSIPLYGLPGIKDSKNFHKATHGDELHYLYCPEHIKENQRESIYEGEEQKPEIRQVMNHMCSLWANFCRTGVPKSDYDTDNVEWRRHKEDNPCFLSISKNLRLMDEPLYKDEWGWFNALITTQPAVESPISPENAPGPSSRST